MDDGTETNETRLGAVKDIQFAMERLGLDDDLLVLAGDNLLDFSLGSFLSYIKEKQASCVMRYSEPSEEKLKKCGVLSIGEDDRILSMVEKPENPPSHWCCPPFYFLCEGGREAGGGRDCRRLRDRRPAVHSPGCAGRARSMPWRCRGAGTISETWRAMRR